MTVLITILMRALASHTSPHVIINGPNPNFCSSNLQSNLHSGPYFIAMQIFEKLFAFTPEEGSRQLVFGAVAEAAGIHGAYIEGNKVEAVGGHLVSEEGLAIQERLWVCFLFIAC